jgi:hypothetical protein
MHGRKGHEAGSAGCEPSAPAGATCDRSAVRITPCAFHDLTEEILLAAWDLPSKVRMPPDYSSPPAASCLVEVGRERRTPT